VGSSQHSSGGWTPRSPTNSLAEFAEEAKRVAVIIIKEMFLPLEKKTIRPKTLRFGGVAGEFT
jgi:hypothetical protein